MQIGQHPAKIASMRYTLMGRYVCILVAVWTGVGQAQVQLPEVSVYLEDSPAAQEMIARASSLRRQDRLAEAVAVYQQVIEQYPRKLIAIGQAMHTDVAGRVHQIIRTDAPLLDAYRRLYEPPSQRGLAQVTATPTPNVQALEQLLAVYELCSAGLEAGLQLAALYLERANIDDAGRILDGLEGHPDLSQRMTRWHKLQASVGLFGDDLRRYRSHVEALKRMSNHEVVAELRAWSDRIQRPQQDRVVDGSEVLPAVPIPDPLGTPLWTRSTAVVPEHTLAPRVRTPITIRGTRPDPVWSPTIPAADADRLYVANRHAVEVLERSSGRQVWSYHINRSAQSDQLNSPFGALSIRSAAANDRRGVLVLGDRLMAVLGVPLPVRPGFSRAGSHTGLVCVDRVNGRLLWQVGVKDLDPSLTTGEFYGTPLPGHDRVHVLVRRMGRSGFQDAYLLAVDAKSGQLLWRRHLFSVAAAQKAGHGFVQMICDRGRLFVADDLGHVACLERRNGAIVWLAVLREKGGRRTGASARHWQHLKRQVPRPVLVKAGLLVSLRSGASAAVLLNPLTGQVVRRLTDSSWREAVQLTAFHDGGVLLVGKTVRLLDGEDLQPRWSVQLGDLEDEHPWGLAAVTEDRVLIPTRKQMVVLDTTDGKVLRRHQIDEPGNVLALPDQVVIAGQSSIRSYLSWSHAYKHLKQRIIDHPQDPGPALALAHISLAANKPSAVLEGVDQAMAVLEGRALAPVISGPVDPVQREVFEQLLELVKRRGSSRVTLRRQLLDRLATVTAGPADEVAYHLEKGAFLVEAGQSIRAVDHYQAILNDPTLSSQMYHHETGWRQGGIEAKRRLAQMIKQDGPGVYARYEAEAVHQIAQLTSKGNVTHASQFIELARRYALSSAAPVAMLAAANALSDRGETAAAIGQLRRAYRHAREPELIQHVAGLVAQLYEQEGQPGRASQWLRRIRRDDPTVQPLRDNKPVSIDWWLTRLVGRPTTDSHLPIIRLPLSQIWSVPEQLLVPAEQPQASWPKHVVATLKDGRVGLRGGPLFEKRWRSGVLSRDVRLLAMTDEHVLLWSDRSGVLWALNTDTGQPIWPSLNTRALLAEIGSAPSTVGSGQANMPGVRWEMNALPADDRHQKETAVAEDNNLQVAVSEMVICVGDPGGRVVGIDRYTGQVLWRTACALDRLNLMEMDDDVVALAGGVTHSSDAIKGGVLVLDTMTGEPLFPMLKDKSPVYWLGLTGDGLMIHATTQQVVAHDLRRGQVEWGVALAGMTFKDQGWINHDLLLLQAEQFNGTVIAIKPTTGQVANCITSLLPNVRRRLSVNHVEDQWHVLTPLQAIALGPDGMVRWKDAVEGEVATDRVLQLISRQYVVLLHPDESAQTPFTYVLYLLERSSGVIHYQHTVGPLRHAITPQVGMMLDNQLVLTSGSSMVVITGQAPAP